MENNIIIDTGIVNLTINGDASKVISFNVKDVSFVERFQSLYGELKNKLAEYEKRAKEIDKVTAVDDNGVPLNAGARIAYMREVCEYMRAKIDNLFGAETSQKAFGDALNLEMFIQFLNGVSPYITSGRAEKIEKYTSPASAKRRKRSK